MRTTRSLFALASLVLLLSACQKENSAPASSGAQLNSELISNDANRLITLSEPLSQTALDELVIASLERDGDFRWDNAPLDWTWSALFDGEQALAIGYQPAGMVDNESNMHKINLQSACL